ncbi:uncharacterized protein LOC130769738 [Actinidia eriantha]|uniref:uncharacterized protein LOC130769738 n=1 Tax=Actinidia eriantha TaxID=165200 RepID=UPI0025868037|nr:uncharacterized protein LOC130769738 [Actinidia eriantha]
MDDSSQHRRQMDSSSAPHHHRPLFLCPHHHHHHHHHFHIHFSPHCPLHSHLLQPNSRPYACPNSLLLPHQSNFQVPESRATHPSDPLIMQEGNEKVVEEDEEDPVFILTDEWREFFAKSEAKRRLAKNQARKKGRA